jgi:single-stranded DNA-binding protein
MGIEAAFSGTLGRDAESKTSAKGKKYLRASVRVGHGDGAQWVNVTAFDPNATAIVNKFVKGAAVYIEGRLTLDKWKANDGSDRTGLNVMSWHCRLAQIGRNKTKRLRADVAPAFAPAAPGKQHADFDDEIPGWTP